MLLGTGRYFGVDDLYNFYLLNYYQGFSGANKLCLWFIV